MNVDAKEDAENGRAMNRSMVLLAAGALAVALGLVTVDQPEVVHSARVLDTDASRSAAPATPGSAPALLPAVRELDPALFRLERGNDHHG